MTRNKDVNNPGNGGRFATPARAESDKTLAEAMAAHEAEHARLDAERNLTSAANLNINSLAFDDDGPNLSPESQRAILDIASGRTVGGVELGDVPIVASASNPGSESDAEHDRLADARQSSRAGRLNRARCSCGWDGDGFGQDSDGQFAGHLADVGSSTGTALPAAIADPEHRARLASLTARELRDLPDGHAAREAWREVATWAEDRGVESMVPYLGSMRTKSIGEMLAETPAGKPTDDDIGSARQMLDNFEHFANSDQFISEVGGQEAFDAEYARRANTFFTLNMRSSTPEQVSSAMATLAALRDENGL